MSKKDYYELLGVDRNANEIDIKKAYRKKSKKNHPDVGGDEELFKGINEAYSILSDPEKKNNYDRYGHNGNSNNGFGNMNMEDIFRNFGFGGGFGQQHHQRVKVGQDLRINIALTLEEILNGANKTFKYNRNAACTTCNSAGGYNKTTCSVCQGQGSIVQHIRTPMGIMQNIEQCHHCSGDGYTYANTCGTCQGQGVQRGEQEISVDIPAGVIDGTTLNYNSMGNAIRDGNAGKLIINITELSHKDYVRNGNDLKYNVKLTYPQLVLGDKVEIPTIDGTTIKIHIPEYSKIGDNLRINGKGLKISNSNGRGDMYISLDVEFPKKISNEEKELLNNLKNINEMVGKN